MTLTYATAVLTVADCDQQELQVLLARLQLQVVPIPPAMVIPGSYWGEREAGLIAQQLFFRDDTPLHSVLHEAAHYVCMDAPRRLTLYRDAGGDHAEEDAVCYLQILLADHITVLGRVRMWQDMDAWGYSFRLGSAQAWFTTDAAEAQTWLCHHGLITAADQVNFSLRQ